GIEELVVNDIVVNDSDVVVAASWDRPIFHLPPGGEPTAQVGPTDRISGGWDIATTPADPNYMTAVVGDIRFCCEGDGQAYTSVFSKDGGRTWEPLPSFEAGTHPDTLRFGSMAINSGDPRNIVWLPSWDGAPHYSRDRGKTWTAVVLPGTEGQIDENGVYTGGSHFQYYLQREVLLADPFVADRFYLFHAENGLLRSDDGGATWEVISADGLPTGWTVGYFHAQLTAVPDRPGHLLYTPGVVLEGFFPMFESTDSGETWSIVANTSDVFAVGYGAPMPGADQPTIYMAGAVNEVAGLYRSTDLMNSWEYLGSTADGIYRIIHAIAGDPGLPGRVYVGFNGTSVVQGDQQ
ncbi:MAG: WD40/YVTN/BNR-like repeat-containing protein, partial [Acidimicrobiales bacterium]